MTVSYVVIKDGVTVKMESGVYAPHGYVGGPVPEGADESHVKMLLADGLIAKAGSKEADDAIAHAVTGGREQTPAEKAAAEAAGGDTSAAKKAAN